MSAHDLEDYASYITFSVDWLICQAECRGLFEGVRDTIGHFKGERAGAKFNSLREIDLWARGQPRNSKKAHKNITQ